MSVILTSFRESENIIPLHPDAQIYSVSRWQPKGYFYPELPFLGAFDEFGDRLHLSGREEPLLTYREDWFSYLDVNREQVEGWLESLDDKIDIILCCWCPHSVSTRLQIKNRLTFACHTGIIGQIINKFRPDIQVIMDKDRDLNLVSKWKPNNYTVIE